MKVIINESSIIKVLERLWSQDPYFDEDKLKMFGISKNNPDVERMFQKFLGVEEMTKRVENIMPEFLNKELYIDGCGTYKIYFKIAHMYIDTGYTDLQHLYLNCDVDVMKSTAIVPFYDPNVKRRPLYDIIYLDRHREENAWEVRQEIMDCIEEYFNDEVEIKKKTGMIVTIRLFTF